MRSALSALLLSLGITGLCWGQDVPADHFPGLTLDDPLPAVLTTGTAVRLAGQLADTGLDEVVFSFAPQGGGGATDFFISFVQNGRFERVVTFAHGQAGTYDLVVYAGQQGQSLPGLGEYSGIEIHAGSGPQFLPRGFFDGLRLDAPLPTDLPVGVSVSLAGQILDPSVRELRFDLETTGGATLRSITVAVDGGRFDRPLRLLPGEVGPLVLAAVVGRADDTWWGRGAFEVRGVDPLRPELEVRLLGLSLQPGDAATIPLLNRGDAELEVRDVRVAAPFEVVSSPDRLAPGERGEIRVTYAGAGGDEVLLAIDSSDPRHPVTQVALSGLGAAGHSTRIEHRRAGADGVLRLDLDFTRGDYALALYSAALDADTGAVFKYGIGGAPPLARPMAPQMRPALPAATRDHAAQDLADAHVRARERAIARQVRQRGLLAAPKPAAIDYAVGDRRNFIFDEFGGVPRQLVPSRVVAANDRTVALVHESWYDSDPNALPATRIQQIIDQFAVDYDLAAATFGAPSDVDGDGRIAFLFTPLVDAVGIAGFQDPNSVVPTDVGGNGNLTDLLFLSPSGPDEAFRSLLIHEFQHLINFHQHVLMRYGESESGWLNEGLSHLSEDLVEGFTDGGNADLVQEYLSDPSATGLHGAALLDRGKRGAAYLFVRSLVDRLGPAVLQRLVGTGLADRDNVEMAVGEPFDELLAFWAAQVYVSGTGVAAPSRFGYSYDLLRADGARGFPMPAALSWSTGSPVLTGRVRPRGASYVRVSGSGRQSVEIHAGPQAALGAAVLALPAGFQPTVLIPDSYFPGLKLEPLLPGELRTGQAVPVAGQVERARTSQLALDFTSRDGGERISFFVDVVQGRVDRDLVFDHSLAGEYDLAVFAGEAGQELDHLGSFSPVQVRPGAGVVQIPAAYFNGIRLDAPLPAAVLLGTTAPVAGQVSDPATDTVLLQITDAGDEAVASAYLDVTGGRFGGSLPTGDLAAGTYRLSLYAGADQLAYAGAYDYLRVVAELPTAVESANTTPTRLALEQNHPNPFNSGTAIRFRLTGSAPQPVRLEVFNALGQSLAVLVDGPLGPGEHVAHWDGRLRDGEAAATGVYIYRLTAGGQTLSRKLVLTR